MTFGYDVNTEGKNISIATLKDHATDLVQGLSRARLRSQVWVSGKMGVWLKNPL
jgi:hypothetical protein